MISHSYRAVSNTSVEVKLDSGKCHIITCNLSDYEDGIKKYKTGAYVQDAFFFLSSDDREFLISGTTPEEWNDMFGKEENYWLF